MLDLAILVLLAFNNSARARLKGQSQAVWVLITVLAFLICEMMGVFLVLALFNNGMVNMQAFMNGTETRDQLQQQLQALYNDGLHSTFIFLCGLGGYLLIRYILDRMPDKKKDVSNHINNINDYE